MRVRPEQLEREVLRILKEYGDQANDKMAVITKDVARQASSELKGTAPTGGEYARGWTHKGIKTGPLHQGEVVYNRKYMLTHLLEKPHATGKYRRGHYPKNKDYTGNIARVEEEYVAKYLDEVMKL